MTVSDILGDKIKIHLSNAEVLDCFGNYERLYSMSDGIKSAFKELLTEVLSTRGLTFNQEMLIQIKAKKNDGCVIIISPSSRRKNTEKAQYLYIFNNSEELTKGILFLYKFKANLESDLYKTDFDYRLIIYSKDYKPYFLTLNEFAKKESRSPLEAAFTKEYGKLLIQKNAVKCYGKHFFKEI